MSKAAAAQASVLTANRLGDGIVVFLDFEGAWSESLGEAVVARSPDEIKALQDRGAYDAAQNIVVEPYLVEVREESGRLVPLRYRERVRAGGPSILDDVPGYSPSSPSPRSSRGEGRGEGQPQTPAQSASAPHPSPLPASGEREQAARAA
jgi:sulfite reductase (NADPH) hemoprotein beta-component